MKNLIIKISADSAEKLDTAVSVLKTMGVDVQACDSVTEQACTALEDARDYIDAALEQLDTRDRLPDTKLEAIVKQVHQGMSRERYRELAVLAGWKVVKPAHTTITRGDEYLVETFRDHNGHPLSLTLVLYKGKGMNRRKAPMKSLRKKHCDLLIEGLKKAGL